jgi:uncharacterized protein DUF6572
MSVSQPDVVDFVVHDPLTDEALLVMVEERAWGNRGQLLPELEAKLNTYLGFIQHRLSVDYPELAGKPVHVQLRSAFPLEMAELEFLRIAMDQHLAPEGIQLSWRIIGDSSGHGV